MGAARAGLLEGERLHRVAWKIVRGLYFNDFAQVLPEDTQNNLEIYPPGKPPPEAFSHVLGAVDRRGAYPGVFDYKYVQVPMFKNFYYWGMLFWDRVILAVSFHNPQCDCNHCSNLRRRSRAGLGDWRCEARSAFVCCHLMAEGS